MSAAKWPRPRRGSRTLGFGVLFKESLAEKLKAPSKQKMPCRREGVVLRLKSTSPSPPPRPRHLSSPPRAPKNRVKSGNIPSSQQSHGETTTDQRSPLSQCPDKRTWSLYLKTTRRAMHGSSPPPRPGAAARGLGSQSIMSEEKTHESALSLGAWFSCLFVFGSTYKRDHTVFVFLCLTYFMEQNALKVHPRCHKRQDSLLSRG